MLIPPSENCPPSQCREIIQVCWADAGNRIFECGAVPAELLRSSPSISADDMMLIVGALWSAIAVAGVMRIIGKSLIRS